MMFFVRLQGLNGKIELEATTNQNLETEIGRDVSIQFVSHNNEQMPWILDHQKAK